MIVIVKEHYVVLQPEPGMLLTDGEDYCTEVFVPLNSQYENWCEVSKEDIPTDDIE